jgi:hypothetical protein
LHVNWFALIRAGDRRGRHPQDRDANCSVKKIRLFNCHLGEECFELLCCCKRLESLEFEGCTLHESFLESRLLAHLDRLVSFSDRSSSRSDEHLRWIAPNLSAAPALRAVKLGLASGGSSLPGLRDVLVSCPGKLSLELGGDYSDVVPLCEGIEAARSLPSLSLTLLSLPGSTAAVLEAVRHNTALLRFEVEFLASGPSDACTPGGHIQALLSSDASLEHFGFGLRSAPGQDSATLMKSAAAFAIRGLRNNRRLRSLKLTVGTIGFGLEPPPPPPPSGLTVDNETSEALVTMLRKRNASLVELVGLSHESREHEEQIASLLALNRHGRDFADGSYHCVPVDLRGEVLSRISNADCKYFVTKLVRWAVNGKSERQKRRRIGSSQALWA